MARDHYDWVHPLWERLLLGLAFLPWYAAYESWRGDRSDLRNPLTVAFLVGMEVLVLWYAWRRRVWWLPRRRDRS